MKASGPWEPNGGCGGVCAKDGRTEDLGLYADRKRNCTQIRLKMSLGLEYRPVQFVTTLLCDGGDCNVP